MDVASRVLIYAPCLGREHIDKAGCSRLLSMRPVALRVGWQVFLSTQGLHPKWRDLHTVHDEHDAFGASEARCLADVRPAFGAETAALRSMSSRA